MNVGSDHGLDRFWRPIEAAAELVRTAPLGRLPPAVADLVDLLAGDLIPRLRAEESVLLPLVSGDLRQGESRPVNHAAVSRAAEAISILALRPASETGRIHRVASDLVAMLTEQRQAEASLVARIRALHITDIDAAIIVVRLEEAARASRGSQLFVAEADRLPTEAWVLRHNPKSVRILSVKDRSSPVADLVAALGVGRSIVP